MQDLVRLEPGKVMRLAKSGKKTAAGVRSICFWMVLTTMNPPRSLICFGHDDSSTAVNYDCQSSGRFRLL